MAVLVLENCHRVLDDTHYLYVHREDRFFLVGVKILARVTCPRPVNFRLVKSCHQR